MLAIKFQKIFGLAKTYKYVILFLILLLVLGLV